MNHADKSLLNYCVPYYFDPVHFTSRYEPTLGEKQYFLSDIEPVLDILLKNNPKLLFELIQIKNIESEPLAAFPFAKLTGPLASWAEKLPEKILMGCKIKILEVLANKNDFQEPVMKFLSSRGAGDESSFLEKYSDDLLPVLTILAGSTKCHEFIKNFLSQPRYSSKENGPKDRSFLYEKPRKCIPILMQLAQGDEGKELAQGLLSEQNLDNKGNTALHRLFLKPSNEAKQLVGLLGGQHWLDSVRNTFGLSPLERVELTMTFLSQPKSATLDGEFTSISDEDYQSRVRELRQWVDTTFAQIVSQYKKEGGVSEGCGSGVSVTQKCL